MPSSLRLPGTNATSPLLGLTGTEAFSFTTTVRYKGHSSLLRLVITLIACAYTCLYFDLACVYAGGGMLVSLPSFLGPAHFSVLVPASNYPLKDYLLKTLLLLVG